MDWSTHQWWKVVLYMMLSFLDCFRCCACFSSALLYWLHGLSIHVLHISCLINLLLSYHDIEHEINVSFMKKSCSNYLSCLLIIVHWTVMFFIICTFIEIIEKVYNLICLFAENCCLVQTYWQMGTSQRTRVCRKDKWPLAFNDRRSWESWWHSSSPNLQCSSPREL